MEIIVIWGDCYREQVAVARLFGLDRESITADDFVGRRNLAVL